MCNASPGADLCLEAGPVRLGLPEQPLNRPILIVEQIQRCRLNRQENPEG